jgi:hypothetical protein
VNEAIVAGRESDWLSTLAPGRGMAWLHAEGWRGLDWASAPASNRALPLRGRLEVIQRWQRPWGPTDDRLVWLATLLVVDELPALAADPQLPARVASWLRIAFTPAGAPPREPKHAEVAPREARPVEPSNDINSSSANALSCASDPPQWLTGSSREPGAPGPQPAPAAARPEGTEESPVLGGLGSAGDFSPQAGLVLVIPILERLGLADYLVRHPALLETGFPARLLCFIGGRVGLTAGDPLAVALKAPAAPPADLGGFELPDSLSELLAAPKPRVALESPLVVWLTAVRRWCRRRGRFGLVTLIRRPGRVLVSRTHLDVCFDLALADVRLRRLALDVDPGWVPWLGRVVRIHYLDAHECPG